MQHHGIHRTCGYLTSGSPWTPAPGVTTTLRYLYDTNNDGTVEQEPAWKTEQNFTDEEWEKFCEEEQVEDDTTNYYEW